MNSSYIRTVTKTLISTKVKGIKWLSCIWQTRLISFIFNKTIHKLYTQAIISISTAQKFNNTKKPAYTMRPIKFVSLFMMACAAGKCSMSVLHVADQS